MSSKQPALTGSCKCGAIKYTSATLPVEMTNCHCIPCRKLSGGPYLTFAGFSPSDIEFISKLDSLQEMHSDIATRGYCKECGSPLYMKYIFQDSTRISFTAGTFDEIRGTLPKITEHIFLEEKAKWFEVPDDGIPRYDGFPGRFGERFEEARRMLDTIGKGDAKE